MRATGVDAGDQEPDAVGSLAVMLGVCLRAVADAGGDLRERNGAAVGEAGGEGLLFHEVGEDARVGGEAGEGDAVVRVDGNNLLLVGGEFFGVALEANGVSSLAIGEDERGLAGKINLQRGKNGMCFADDADDD